MDRFGPFKKNFIDKYDKLTRPSCYVIPNYSPIMSRWVQVTAGFYGLGDRLRPGHHFADSTKLEWKNKKREELLSNVAQRFVNRKVVCQTNKMPGLMTCLPLICPYGDMLVNKLSRWNVGQWNILCHEMSLSTVDWNFEVWNVYLVNVISVGEMLRYREHSL